MLRKVLIFMCAICTLNCWATNVHWGNTIITTCESGDDITVPTEEPTPQIGYHFVGWTNFRQVEYLEFNRDNANINTGFVPDVNTKVRVKLRMNAYTGGIIIGYYSSENNSYRFFNHNGQIYFDYGGVQNRISGSRFLNNTTYDFLLGSKYVKDFESGAILIGREENNPYVFSESIRLGGDNRVYGKIFLAQIWDNDVLVRDFIPVIDENDIPCLYDKVEDRLYYNSGTGDFIAGPVVGSGGLSTTRYTVGDTIPNGCHGDLDDIYFYPVFEPNTIDIYWDDGTDIKQTQCTYGMPIINVPDDPVRPGYKFGGWRIKNNN